MDIKIFTRTGEESVLEMLREEAGIQMRGNVCEEMGRHITLACL